MKQIIIVPNDILSSQAKDITSFDKRSEKLVADLKSALLATKNPKGVGLAAPQIGEPYRAFVTRPTEKSEVRVFINPQIIEKTAELTDGIPERENKLEGCLSIPKIWGKVRRMVGIRLRYQDEKGKMHEETFHGFLATIIQHETDHVNGILFTQRVLEQKGKLYQEVTDVDGKGTLEEIKISLSA